MANTIVNKEVFAADTQGFLMTQTPAISVCSTRFESTLSKGQKVHYPYVPEQTVGTYSYSTDITMPSTVFVDDYLTVDQVKQSSVNWDPIQNNLAHQENWQTLLAKNAAEQLTRNVNQHVLTTGNAGASTTVAGGALSYSNAHDFLTDVSVGLSRGRGVAPGDKKFALVEPAFVGYLGLANISDGFKASDESLSDGFVGKTASGFYIYECWDIPTTVSLTVSVQPTAGDTFTILGYTWTCVADGATATAGQVKIGTNLADFQAIFLTLIAGTTPPSAGDYVDYSTDQRNAYKNAQLAAGAWGTNVSVLTAFGRIGGSETFTSGSNVFGTETASQLFGTFGAVDICMQEMPMVVTAQEQRNASQNIMTFATWGTKVFTRNAKRLVKGTMNL